MLLGIQHWFIKESCHFLCVPMHFELHSLFFLDIILFSTSSLLGCFWNDVCCLWRIAATLSEYIAYNILQPSLEYIRRYIRGVIDRVLLL